MIGLVRSCEKLGRLIDRLAIIYILSIAAVSRLSIISTKTKWVNEIEAREIAQFRRTRL